MTFFEKWKKDHPGYDWAIYEDHPVGSCPTDFGYEEHHGCVGMRCRDCWSREIPEERGLIIGDEKVEHPDTDIPHIKDSGDRTEFETGAVRDMREGKGRCDLVPLDIAGEWLKDDVLGCIAQFQTHGTTVFLYGALNYFLDEVGWSYAEALLEVAIHFEEGAKKYGPDNWRMGIDVYCYIDSAVRHYLKFLRGDKDEPHDRAVIWNLMCAIWTCDHMPELNGYRKEE